MIFRITNSGDIYEVRLKGHVIAGIVCYLNGSGLRQEVEYDILPRDVQDEILDRILVILQSE